MKTIAEKLLKIAEFIESHGLTDDQIIAAGATSYAMSTQLECEAFFSVSTGHSIEYDDYGETAHGHSFVGGMALVCVADTEPELQKLRSLGKARAPMQSVAEMSF